MRALVMVYFVLSILVSTSALAQPVWVDWEAMNLLNDMDQCAHNDAGKVGTFDVKTFDAKTAMAAMIEDQEGGQKYCSKAQRKVTDRAEVVNEFRKLLREPNLASCIAKTWAYPRVTSDRIADFIGDSSNLLSFASLYHEDFEDGPLNASESCMYYNFYVFRKDGTAVKFTVNYTD